MRLGYFVPRAGGGTGAPLALGPGYLVSGHYDQSDGVASSLSTTNTAADRMQLYPWTPTRRVRLDRLGVEVTNNSGAGRSVKIVVYAADDDGLPGALIHETDAIPTEANGYAFAECDLVFEAGQVYYLGIRGNNAVALRCLLNANSRTIGPVAFAAATIERATAWERTVTYADPAPDPYVPIAAEAVRVATQLVRFRVAAL